MDEGLWQLARDVDPHERRSWIEPDDQAETDPLATNNRLRREHPEWSPELIAAVATQRELGARARSAGALPTQPWLVTRTGLEQSTRPQVAMRRATFLAEAGIASVVDTTAGLGVDSWAFAQAGLSVLSVERDPLLAQVCQANVPAARVINADATAGLDPSLLADLPQPTCWFVDPARRGRSLSTDGRRAAPERDPERWSPPWSFVESLVADGRFVAAKAPGGFTPAEHWACEWVGHADYVVECALYHLPTSPLEFRRQATLLESDHVDQADRASRQSLTFEVDSAPLPIGPVAEFVVEPHPVFHRCLPALCRQGPHRLHGLSPDSTWLTGDVADDAPHNEPRDLGLRWYRVLESVPPARLRDATRSLGIESLAIKSRESKAGISALRTKVGLPDGNHFAAIWIAGIKNVLLAERL